MSRERELTDSVEASLLGAEREIDLLDTVSPTNWNGEVERLVEMLERGHALSPRFIYATLPNLDRCYGILEAAEVALARLRGFLPADLLAERVVELRLEARISDARGSERVQELSRLRYPFSEAEFREATELARQWLATTENESDAVESQVSLASELTRLCRSAGLDVPIVERPVVARACVTEDQVWVKRGCRVSRQEARRIFHHELFGHYLPRRAARSRGAPYRIGTQGANEDEEGRALLLEERAGLLQPKRRRELALRHLASLRIRDQAPPGRVVEEFLTAGHPPRPTLEAVLRAARGGGLAREVIYLPAYLRVKSAYSSDPSLERFARWGRISAHAARLLASWEGS